MQDLPPLTSSPRRHLPLFAHAIPAGFPSPAEEYAEGMLDLNRYLVPDPPATVFVRVPNAALTGRGVHAGDLLVVNRALRPRAGHLVWAELDGERLVCDYRPQDGQIWLRAPQSLWPMSVWPAGRGAD